MKEFVVHHSCFQIPRFLVNLSDNNCYLVYIMVRTHMYSLVASCNVTTFTKMDQLQEAVKLHTSFFNMKKISNRYFQVILFKKCKTTMKR